MMEFIVVVVFSAEYLLRLVLAEKWYRFAFSFEGIVDLLAVLPFYLAIGVDLRTLRVLRLFRLLRLFKFYVMDGRCGGLVGFGRRSEPRLSSSGC